jgi:thiosulfate/3-mercaptopyruvate sulfurtransferase
VAIYDEAGGGLAAARAWWMLRAVGHHDVAVIDGGLQAARGAGLPTESGPPRPVEEAPPYPTRGWSSARIDAEEVERIRRDPRWRLLDVRASERFRGEHEPFDPVAGRIPGAVNLPWEEALDPSGRFKPPSELAKKLDEVLGDTPPERTVVHCGSGVTACHTLLVMESLGRPGAALYVGSWSEWCRGERARETGEP